MRVTLWGTRGSLAAPGADTARYGGNTSCVQVEGTDGTQIVLDAGTGIRRLSAVIPKTACRVDILLTHLHLDHILGLGFFGPLDRPDCQVHIWGPPSTTQDLRTRLTRYLSPPLFPVRLRDLQSHITLHEVPSGEFQIGEFCVNAALVCHPGPTVGYRIESPRAALAYLPDHEPALGAKKFPGDAAWTSGYAIAENADWLIHDSQYDPAEYREHVGWGHSSLHQALVFGELCRVKNFVPFHHDPSHSDKTLDRIIAEAVRDAQPRFAVIPGIEGVTLEPGKSSI